MVNINYEYSRFWSFYLKASPNPSLLENNFLQILYSILLIFFFLTIIKIIFKKKNLNRAYFFYFYHLIFSSIFYFYTNFNVNDSKTFFIEAFYPTSQTINMHLIFPLFIQNAIFLLNNIFNFSLLNYHLIFGFIGYLGIFLIDCTIQKKLNGKKIILQYFFTLLLLFPSLHFWSSGLSKESLTIFFMGLIIYSLEHNILKYKLIGILLSLITRVHISFILICALISNLFIKLNIKLYYKAIIFFILFLFSFIIVTKIFTGSYYNLETFNKFYEYSEIQRTYNINFNTWYDTKDFGSVKLIIYHLFYPLNKYDNLKNIYISLENSIFVIIYLVIFFKIVLCFNKLHKIKNLFFYIIFSFLTIFLLSHFIDTYGINLRQKWIYTPCILMILLKLLILPKLNEK